MRPEIRALLTWVQDINWPVALPIIEVLSEYGADLVEPITEVLQGNDEAWKYYLIVYLIPRIEMSAVKELEPEILRIALFPTKAELSEEVNEVAEEFIKVLRANA